MSDVEYMSVALALFLQRARLAYRSASAPRERFASHGSDEPPTPPGLEPDSAVAFLSSRSAAQSAAMKSLSLALIYMSGWLCHARP